MARKRKKNRITMDDILKALRKGSREAELENSNGWKCKRKIHKSKKTYTRKRKHNNNY